MQCVVKYTQKKGDVVMLFFYIRHGDPIYDPDSLTPLGMRQAEAVAKRLSMHGIHKIYSSTSERAQLTSQPTCEMLKLDRELVDFAHEDHAWHTLTVISKDGYRRWGFEDKDTRRLFTSPEMKALGDKWYEHPALEGYKFKEGIERVQTESDKFFSALGYDHIKGTGTYRVRENNAARVALFAHQGFGLAFLSSILDINYPQFCTHFDFCHTGMTVIEFADEDGVSIPRVLTHSSDSHIYREGLPTAYNNITRF